MPEFCTLLKFSSSHTANITTGARLYNVFVAYCSFGKGVRRCEEMEGNCFARLCKDCRLLQSCECGKASVDIVFYRFVYIGSGLS